MERAVFSPSTGYPAVDFEAAEWRRDAALAAGAAAARRGLDPLAAGTAGPRRTRPADCRRNAGPSRTGLASCGRHRSGDGASRARRSNGRDRPLRRAPGSGGAVGPARHRLAPGAPACRARVGRRSRRLLPRSTSATSPALVGPGGVGAVLPMFWFLAARLGPVRIAVVAASSALFLHPLWLRPVAAMEPSPAPESVLHRLLPTETGQRPRAGEPADLFVGDVWLRPVAGSMTPFGESELLIEGDSAEFLVAWRPAAAAGNAPGAGPRSGAAPGGGRSGRCPGAGARPGAAPGGGRSGRCPGAGARPGAALGRRGGGGRVAASFWSTTPRASRSRGARWRRPGPLPSGRTSVRLLLDPPEARHRAWWSPGRRVELHRLRLTLDDGGAPFALHLVRIGSAR